MTRLNELLQARAAGTINESDYPELIDLMEIMIIEQGDMVKYYGEQLEFLMNEKVRLNITKKVN